MGHVREAAVMWLETWVHRQIGCNVRRGSVMCRLLAGPGMWTMEILLDPSLCLRYQPHGYYKRKKKKKKLCKGDNSLLGATTLNLNLLKLHLPWKLKQTKLVELVQIF